MLPDFIGVGAQKSGTSWIFACLEEHPEICMPVKEIHFFSKKKLYEKGLKWYKKQFKYCNSKHKIGEFSTTYLHSNEALNKIYLHYPNIKIIVSIRDPISRALSHFQNDIMAGSISKEAQFFDLIVKKPEYWKRGLYHKKISWLFKKFGKDKVCVLFIEDAKENPQAFIRSIYKFLNVDKTFISSSLNKKINVSNVPRFVRLGLFMDFISKIIRKLGMTFFIRYLRAKGVIDFARKANASSKNSFNDQIIWPKRIIEELDIDRQKLEILLDRDIKSWKSYNYFEKKID